MPLAVLHDLLRQVGLLRLRGGVLHGTKAARDDLHVVRRLRSTFEPGEFETIVATTAIATLAAHGAHRPDHLATRLLPQIGHGWVKNSRAITAQDVHTELCRHTPTLQALDQNSTDTLAHTWDAPPPAPCSPEPRPSQPSGNEPANADVVTEGGSATGARLLVPGRESARPGTRSSAAVSYILRDRSGCFGDGHS